MTSAPNIDLLRTLPSVHELISDKALEHERSSLSETILVDIVRAILGQTRAEILAGTCTSLSQDSLIKKIALEAQQLTQPSLRPAINATGIIMHTNLGRSALAPEALAAVNNVARGYSTLEYDVGAMARGSRHSHIEETLCLLTCAEAALAVNNNAAAVMMILSEFAAGHEAVVSRGELVEIGGSFRIPDIMELSGATMVEVGTTNKTHLRDYHRAISANTSMLLKVHPSNYQMVGFTEAVSISELKTLADEENKQRSTNNTPPLLVYEDLGSGALLHLESLGENAEPTVTDSLTAGADLVSFSGDKLLGGPQAGIIVGSKHLINRLKKNPLARVLRLDKMTLAALEATLKLYLKPEQAQATIPTLRALSEDSDSVQKRAIRLAKQLNEVLPPQEVTTEVIEQTARAGGGALPLCDIPSYCVRITFLNTTPQACERFLIQTNPLPIIGRIHNDALLLDARTIDEDELITIVQAFENYFKFLAKEHHE